MGRIASTPWTWPAIAGRPRAAAQRRLPSMMIATCRGCSRTGSASDLHHFRFFALAARVDGLDETIRHPLQRVQLAALLVLRQAPVSQRLLQVVGHLATM